MDLKKDIKHIIWDWNGTLVDDTEFCVNIINRVLKRRTLPEIDVEAYRDTFDFPVIDYYKRIGFDLTKHDFKVLSSEFINAYIDGRRQLKLHNGAIEMLRLFAIQKIPQCLLSASQTHALKETLREHSIDHFFKTVLGLDHHYADGKAHLGNQWLEQHDVDKKHVLFIGDTLHDLEVANEIGIRCILIASGHHSKARLCSAHPYVMDHLKQLLGQFR